MAGAFTPEMKLRMEDINNEFHLEASGDGKWNLYPYKIERYVHEQKIRQPGEPLHSVFEFDNPHEKQPVMFIITLIAGETNPGVIVKAISLEVNNQSFLIPVEMKPGQNLKLDADGSLNLFDSHWNTVRKIIAEGKIPDLLSGNNKIIVDSGFSEEGNAKLKLELKTRGNAEPVYPELH